MALISLKQSCNLPKHQIMLCSPIRAATDKKKLKKFFEAVIIFDIFFRLTCLNCLGEGKGYYSKASFLGNRGMVGIDYLHILKGLFQFLRQQLQNIGNIFSLCVGVV